MRIKIMKKVTVLSALIAASVLSAGVALAAPAGFGGNASAAAPGAPAGFEGNRIDSVAAVKDRAHDDQKVTLRGRLTNYLGKDMYEFTDEAGDTIEVELDDDRNWSNISKDQLIDIYGEVDKDLMSINIDVKRAVPVQQ